jgi:hypothetical protein
VIRNSASQLAVRSVTAWTHISRLTFCRCPISLRNTANKLLVI